MWPDISGMPQNVKTRNVSLTPENEAFIIERVASGRFGSASEVVRAALRLLQEDERHRDAPRTQPKQRDQATFPSDPAQG